MQPSSLIFLVIVAIWVAYLVQHWVHRREHLATARSVDKFSDAMRLLERRSPVSEPSPATSPLRARARAGGPLPPAHDIPVVELVPSRTPAQIVLRRVRGLFFLAALVAVPVCLILSAAHILKWLSVGIAVVGLAVATVWLRVEAIREQNARRARRAAHRQLVQSRSQVGRSSIRSRRTLAEPARTAAPAAPVRREAVLPDEQAASSASSAPTTVPEHPAEPAADAGSWRPVPVPPPTYTLKEPAHVREPLRPVPIEVEDEIESVPSLRQRRVVGS